MSAMLNSLLQCKFDIRKTSFSLYFPRMNMQRREILLHLSNIRRQWHNKEKSHFENQHFRKADSDCSYIIAFSENNGREASHILKR